MSAEAVRNMNVHFVSVTTAFRRGSSMTHPEKEFDVVQKQSNITISK